MWYVRSSTYLENVITSKFRYKTPYINNVNPDVEDFYKNPFGIPIFVNFFGMFYGFLKYQIATQTTANHNDS